MIRVVVRNSIASYENRAIISAMSESGDLVRVITEDAIWPIRGEVYDVTGSREIYTDQWGHRIPQIRATAMVRHKPSGALLGPWLQGISGIGPTRAQRLLDHYGETLLEALTDTAQAEEIAIVLDPSRPALALKLAIIIQSEFISSEASAETARAEFAFHQAMEKTGIDSIKDSRRMWRVLGCMDGIMKMRENPYLGASLFDWKSADKIGKCLLVAEGHREPDNHPKRFAGACDAVWRTFLARGETAATHAAFLNKLPGDLKNSTEVLKAGEAVGAVIRGRRLWRAPGAAWLEKTVAARLAFINQAHTGVYYNRVSEAVRTIEEETGLSLTEDQRLAVTRLIPRTLGVLQGGAGVGKTTTMKVLVRAAEYCGAKILMCCIAGKAALNLSRAVSDHDSSHLAYTVARLVRLLKKREELEAKGEEVPFDIPKIDEGTLVLIDEASMLDLSNAYQLLRYFKEGTQLLLVGDHGQLPPVGLGKIFHDLVERGEGVSNLTRVLRQASDSPIPYVAKSIREGNNPTVPAYEGDLPGIYLASCSEAQTFARCLEIYREFEFTSERKDILVCAALRRTVGFINQAMSQGHREDTVRFGPLAPSVSVGDPVVCMRNRYSDGIFNGLLGTVTQTGDPIDQRNLNEVLWDGEVEPMKMTPEALSDICLAYAITCHKAQGSSVKKVIIPLEKTQILTREWLYTSITRARETVVLVGPDEAIGRAVANSTVRHSEFCLDLTEAMNSITKPA